MRWREGVLGILLVMLFIVHGALAQGAPAGVGPSNPVDEVQIAPLNPEFVKFQQQHAARGAYPQACDGHVCGYVPPPVEPPKARGIFVAQSVRDGKSDSGSSTVSSAGSEAGIVGTLPTYYDLRQTGKLTSVKDQGACGSCWAFATYGSLESYLRPSETWDFSEDNLKNTHGFDLAPCSGGNHQMSTAYLTRWSGPVQEADDPYQAFASTPLYNLPVQKHVQDVIFLTTIRGPSDDASIKQAILDYGAVYTVMGFYGNYYNSQNFAYYQPWYITAGSNHAIALVGWDDSFSRYNFNNEPPGDGAFIARNSWGTSFGQDGYFYISYYDRNTGTTNAVFTAASPETFDNIYAYDPLGWVNSLGYSGQDSAYFANVFTATGDQQIEAVGFYAHEPGSNYVIDTYLNPALGPINNSGTAGPSTSGAFSGAGYHTVTLSSPVQLKSGDRFSVVVRLQTPGYTFPVPMEGPQKGYSSAATAKAGQSYISSDSVGWNDLTKFYRNWNVCLKAYTDDAAQQPPNNAPEARDDSYTTDEDIILLMPALGVLANDADLDGDPLTATLVSTVDHGILSLHANGSFIYTPSSNYNGGDSFTYKAYDGESYSNVATVRITVDSVNDAPSASDDSYSTVQGTALNVPAPGVLGNDADVDGDTLTAILSSDPSYGALTLNADGSFTYTPNGEFIGIDTFTYQANDGTEDSNIATVTIRVDAAIPSPIADFSAFPTSGKVPLNVQFTDLSGGTITSWYWNFGDGGVSSLQNPRHRYTRAGTYTVSLTVRGPDGKYDTKIIENLIHVTPKK